MNTEVTKTTTPGALVAQSLDQNEEILSQNLVIPRLLLMQGLSDLVAERKAVMGDMVRSTTGEKLGDPDKAIEFIPLTFTNTWVITEKVGGKFEYRGQEPLTAANQDLPWKYEDKGTEWQRTKSLNLHALLVSDVTAEQAELAKAKDGEFPDPDKALLPIMISFRSTSYQAGKAISTHFAKARKFGMQGYVSVLKLVCRQEKNEKGTYYVFDIAPGGKTSKDTMAVCEYWRNLVASGRVEVEAEKTATAPAPMDENSRF